MGKVDDYRERLRALPVEEWDVFLRSNSNLPGTRANLELSQAVEDEASRDWLLAHATIEAPEAPENTSKAFVAFCGVRGLGRLVAAGDDDALRLLLRRANDPRWRIREGVAMALQRVGDADMPRLIEIAAGLSGGSALERRAAAAALAEPRLLADPAHAPAVLDAMDRFTASVAAEEDRASDAFRALRQAMGYCWSVVIAAYPDAGKPAFERWLTSSDPDVRWLLRENLKKKRLQRLDAAWVEKCLERLH